jgi:serine/threonine-protein kinase
MAKIDPGDLPVAVGQVIAGRYAISRVLGVGGMGVVLGGKHLELGEKVAIKFLHKEHSGHAERFFREARAAARIRSEHVVRIYDVGRLPGGEPFIVMEHLDGEDLAERLRRDGPMDPRAVADVLLDVCEALAEAHAVGIVHRDLKPANMFLARAPGGDDIVKLLDFGVAKVPEGGAITKTATILGSPVYMSPEQLMAAKDVDARSDIWSLGVILYELLTGSLPFEGDSIVHLALILRQTPTPRARDAAKDVPEELDAVIAKCLEKERADRFANVAEFAEALAPFVTAGRAEGIPRIRRILAEGRQKNEALASTMPPASEEPLSPTVTVPKIEPLGVAATLSAVATSASGIIAAPAAEKRSRSRALALGAAMVACVFLGVFGRTMLHPQAETKRSDDPRSSTVAAASPEPPPAVSTIAPAPAPPPSAVPTPAETAPPAPAPRVVKKEPRPVAPVASPAREKAAVSCNPPFTIDEKGLRHPKPECM